MKFKIDLKRELYTWKMFEWSYWQAVKAHD